MSLFEFSFQRILIYSLEELLIKINSFVTKSQHLSNTIILFSLDKIDLLTYFCVEVTQWTKWNLILFIVKKKDERL